MRETVPCGEPPGRSALTVYNRKPSGIRECARCVVGLRCPVCAEGKPFVGVLNVDEHCAVCGYRFRRESGYFVGSIYFNYAATAGIAIAGYFGLEIVLGMTFRAQIGIWLTFTAVFPFWFLRYARSLWMALDLAIAPPEEGDFVTHEADRDGA